jgi:hypothetical protein
MLHKLPWIPSDEQWRQLLDATRPEPLRNRVMLALAYDAGLHGRGDFTTSARDGTHGRAPDESIPTNEVGTRALPRVGLASIV